MSDKSDLEWRLLKIELIFGKSIIEGCAGMINYNEGIQLIIIIATTEVCSGHSFIAFL